LMLMYYVLPWFYCDYRDVAWTQDKSRRLRVIFAGLYYQLVTWAVAMTAWFLTEPGPANSLWLALAVSAGLGFLLFSANPLVKMDGYLFLMSYLEIPRLRERALAAFGSSMLGRPQPEPFTPRERRWFLVFGLLTALYVIAHLVVFLTLVGLSLTGSCQAGGA